MPTPQEDILSEDYVQDAFHSYLKSSLTQAKGEHLVDAELLASAQSDLMITGPALCLYFAALRCTTLPPSVPLPRRSSKSSRPSTPNGDPMNLSEDNCPPAFIPFLRVWAHTVPIIQALAPEHQHDLARVICGLDPIAQPLHPSISGVSADLRAVAIEISQRRSFQDRYANDLQAALDAGEESGSSEKRSAHFQPPPAYTPSPTSSVSSSPRYQELELPPQGSPGPSSAQLPSPGLLSPFPQPSSSHSAAAGPSSRHHRTASNPELLPAHSPAISFIRETLYASLADALSSSPTLRQLLRTDPRRAYFASVAFAILNVATTSMTNEGAVVGVLGTELTLAQCPPPLQPLMKELAAIGRDAVAMENEDMDIVMKAAERGDEVLPEPRMERVKKMLEVGVGYEHGPTPSSSTVTSPVNPPVEPLHPHHRLTKPPPSPRPAPAPVAAPVAAPTPALPMRSNTMRRSIEGRAVAFANRINGLSLKLTSLPQFKERQGEVFKVLAGVGS